MLQRSIAVIEDANAIPQFRLLVEVSWLHCLQVRENIPWDQRGGTRLVGRPSRPAAGHPSSDSSGLVELAMVLESHEMMFLPRLPQTSPFVGSTFRMVRRYSTAAGKASLVRRMQAMPCIAGTDHWLNFKACS